MRAKQQGFTLIELMVIVAIIAIIGALALPSMLRSKITANEASAISTMKAILTGEEQIKMDEGAYGNLDQLRAGGYISFRVVDFIVDQPPPPHTVWVGKKADYEFHVMSKPPPDPDMTPQERDALWSIGFCVCGDPGLPDETGVRSFYGDTEGVIRVGINPAIRPNPPVGLPPWWELMENWQPLD